MARKPKLEKLTVSLLKEGLARQDALRDVGIASSHRVSAIDEDADSLFVAATPPHAPSWKAYIARHVAGQLDELITASASAVLLLEAKGRLLAITFGQGRHLLNAEAFEHDFGLRVVLNTVAPDQLKSVDAKTIDETTVHTRRDLSRDSPFSAFGLDVSRDLLRAVTGTPRDTSFAHRLTGADALGIHTRAQIPELPALAERLLEEYEAEHYKEHFDFIDYLRPEKNPARLRELDEALVSALSARDITDAHFAAPETLDWVDLDGFRFSCMADDDDSEPDPRISTYLMSREDDEMSLTFLKGDRLIALRASDGQLMADWPVYRCIVYQVEIDDCMYVLSGGLWFRVDLGYKNKVDAEIRTLKQLSGLPDADEGTDEGTYNAKAAEIMSALCLDKKLVYDGGPDKMEICDILTRDGGLIHVKQRGSSSTLTHLFAQGVNSAERLLLDQDFRAKARAVTAGEDPSFVDVLPEKRPNAGDYEISFVVITRSKRDTPLTLPFFSLISLRNAASRLQGLGFGVSIAAVLEASKA